MSFLLPGAFIASAVKGAKKMKSNPTTYNVFTPGQHGKAYQDLANANPYANVTYRQSWIQKLLEGLGFRTNKDAYLESMALQAQEYDNQISQKEYNETYDSPLEQVKRERLAGINPDLAGNVSPGESQSPVDDGNPPIAPNADDLSIVQNFASGVLNAVQAAFGIAGQVQSLSSIRLDNESKTMQMVKSAWNMIIPDIYENRNDLESGRIDVNNYYNSLKKQFGHTMSKKQFDSFVNRVNQFANSAEGWKMVYDTQSNKAKSRKSMFREFSDESYSEWDDIMQGIGDALGDLAFKVQESGLRKDLEYNESFDAETAAKLESNPDDLRIRHNEREMSDYQNQLRSSFRSIMNKLDSLEKKGNHIAPIVKAVLSTWLMGMMPSISLPSRSKTVTSGPKVVL